MTHVSTLILSTANLYGLSLPGVASPLTSTVTAAATKRKRHLRTSVLALDETEREEQSTAWGSAMHLSRTEKVRRYRLCCSETCDLSWPAFMSTCTFAEQVVVHLALKPHEIALNPMVTVFLVRVHLSMVVTTYLVYFYHAFSLIYHTFYRVSLTQVLQETLRNNIRADRKKKKKRDEQEK